MYFYNATELFSIMFRMFDFRSEVGPRLADTDYSSHLERASSVDREKNGPLVATVVGARASAT